MEINTTIALAAILIAAWSAWSAHKVTRRLDASGEPAVACIVTPVKNQPGWFEVQISVTNRCPYPVKAESLAIVRPGDALLVSWEDAGKTDGYGGWELRSPVPLADARRQIEMKMSLARAGANPQTGHLIYGTRDHHSESAFLFVPPSSLPSTVKLRFCLAIMESMIRRVSIELRQVVHATNSSVID